MSCYDGIQDPLPDHFIRGLSSASLQGRAQIVPDSQVNSEEKDKDCSLVFYLDGAHSPESMEICAKWFSHATKDDRRLTSSVEQSQTSSSQKVCLTAYLLFLMLQPAFVCITSYSRFLPYIKILFWN